MCLGCVFDVCSILFEQGVWFNCFHVCLCMFVCLSVTQPASQSVSQPVSQPVSMNIYNHSHICYIQENHFCSMPMCMYMYIYICIHIQFVFDCCI